MVVDDRKSRMISFRLSPPQYEALKRLYREYGSRSVSEFAREAMERLIAQTPSERVPLAERFEKIADRVEALDREVARLSRIVANETEGRR